MLRLNIRFTQPMLSIHTQLGRLETHSTPAVLTSENRMPRSNAGWTQPKIDIDAYESEKAYGHLNPADFAAKYGQQGFSDLQQATRSATGRAWNNIDNAARPGTDLIQQFYEGKVMKTASEAKNRHIVAELIPPPKITVTPGHVMGEPDLGDLTQHAQSDPFATSHFTPGQVDAYLQQKGNVRQWVTEDHYDIYA